MSTDHESVRQAVLKVYQRVNPSTFRLEDPEYFATHCRALETHFVDHLKFPLAMFRGARVLDLGAGTGDLSVFYAMWGARLTCVEMNAQAITRLRRLFEESGVADLIDEIYHGSLFDWEHGGREPFDVTVSDGVLHHTHDARLGFAKQVKHLKTGGFTILAVPSASGLLQRNLQRWILYVLSGNREDEIVRLARRLFKEHLRRAVTLGGRSEEAVIYDSFVNPKLKSFPVASILQWFAEEKVRFYSAWPPIVTVPLGDSQRHPPIAFEGPDARHVGALAQCYWMVHGEDDAEWLAPTFSRSATVEEALADFTVQMGDLTPENAGDLRADDILTVAAEFQARSTEMLSDSTMDCLRNRLDRFLTEVADVVTLVKRRDVEELERVVDACHVLFRGTCGVGINYFVGYKV